MFRQPVGVVHPALTAGAAIGAGAFLLWLRAQAERRALEQFKHSRAFTSSGLYRKPNYSGMSGAELKRATQLLDSWREDFYQDPLTGTMIERREVQKELLRRSGQGGFLFIPPVPVAAPAVSAGAPVAWAALSTAAAGLLLRVFLPQIWGFLKQTRASPAPNQFYPVGYRKVASGNFLKLASSQNGSGWGGTMNEHLSLVNTGRPGPYGTTYWRHNFKLASGVVTFDELPRTAAEVASQALYVLPGGIGVELNSPPVELAPGTAPQVEPVAVPQPLPPLPLPAVPEIPPTVAPDDPTLPQVVPTTPGPSAPPATVPEVLRRMVPLPLDGAELTKDGLVVPRAPAPVAVTPPDAHFPVPGAPPVTGNGPRPTPRGIAQELGRLEQKLARLSNPGPGGNGDGTDRLGLLFQTLNRLVDFLTSITAGGGYELSSPCVLDDFDERIVTTVEYGGGLSSLDVLSNKIDALAALIQAHKDLKQPICKQTPAVGQPVTVDFLQVD